MAPKFADIAKPPTDLLLDDYTTKLTLKCTKLAGNVAVTLETERGLEGALISKVGARFNYAGLSFDKVQLTPTGGTVLESSLVPAAGVKLHFKGNTGADLGVDYVNGNFVATGKLDVKDMSMFATSACLGLKNGITVGGDTVYNMTGKQGIAGFNAGASYVTGPLFASVTTAANMSKFNVACLYKVNPDLNIATLTTHTNAQPCSVVAIGGAYKAPFGFVKAKVGSDGIVSACLIKEIAPKVLVTASGTMAYSDISTFKYGLGIIV